MMVQASPNAGIATNQIFALMHMHLDLQSQLLVSEAFVTSIFGPG